MKKFIFFVFSFILTFNIIYADSKIIKHISIEGNIRTKDYILLNEIEIKQGEEVTEDRLDRAKTNLQNLNLFSSVNIKFDNEILKIEVEERWTTIPILKFTSSGNVKQTTLGIYDPNIFGHFFELGAQYERLEETNSGVVWFKNPRIFGKKRGLDFQYWKTNRLRTKYFQNQDNPIIKNAFLHERDKLYLAFNEHFAENSAFTIMYEYNRDNFSNRFISPAFIGQENLPPKTEIHFLGTGLSLGKINYEEHLVWGSKVDMTVKQGISATDNIQDFSQMDIAWNFHQRIGKKHQLANRFMTGATTTKLLQYWHYLGGLDRIRGFVDNRFSGRYFWLNNLEFRYFLCGNKNVLIQNVAFLDLANTSEKVADISSLVAASTGFGMRFFLPRIYRFVLRLDYAKPLKKDDSNNLSFGIQQFF